VSRTSIGHLGAAQLQVGEHVRLLPLGAWHTGKHDQAGAACKLDPGDVSCRAIHLLSSHVNFLLLHSAAISTLHALLFFDSSLIFHTLYTHTPKTRHNRHTYPTTARARRRSPLYLSLLSISQTKHLNNLAYSSLGSKAEKERLSQITDVAYTWGHD